MLYNVEVTANMGTYSWTGCHVDHPIGLIKTCFLVTQLIYIRIKVKFNITKTVQCPMFTGFNIVHRFVCMGCFV